MLPYLQNLMKSKTKIKIHYKIKTDKNFRKIFIVKFVAKLKTNKIKIIKNFNTTNELYKLFHTFNGYLEKLLKKLTEFLNQIY